MSGKLMSQVYEFVFDHAESSILGAMADHAKDDGSRCFPSVGRIAWKTNYSARQVQRVIARLEERGVLLPIAYAKGGRGFATEYQIVLSAAPAKDPYVRPDRTLDPRLRVATIARFEEICQSCNIKGTHGKGPDGWVWEIPRIDQAQGFKPANVTLSCGTCLEEKGDILSSDLDEPDEYPDTPVAKGDNLSENHDTAMSPQPSLTHKETEDETDVEPDARDDEPAWFLPMRELHGFVNRNNTNFIAQIMEICEDPKVKATPVLLVASFVSYYRAHRLEKGWKDPVACLRNTLEREIAKVGRLSTVAKEELLREVGIDPAAEPQPEPVVPAPWDCEVCRDQGYYMVDGHPAWCDHSGNRKTKTGHMDELNLDDIWK